MTLVPNSVFCFFYTSQQITSNLLTSFMGLIKMILTLHLQCTTENDARWVIYIKSNIKTNFAPVYHQHKYSSHSRSQI